MERLSLKRGRSRFHGQRGNEALMIMKDKGASWALFWAISLFGTPFFYITAIAYLLRANPSLAIRLIFILAFTEFICGVIKYIYPKERPVPMPNKTFVQKYFAGSFPSVHTARISAFSIAIIASYANKIFILTALLAVIGVGYSRIYLKKHYLEDVLWGFAIGAVISAAELVMQSHLNTGLNFSAVAGFGFFLLKCFYFMLPAYFANMAPVIVKKINLLVFPVDFGMKLGGKPVLGKNKTFRGFVFGVIFAVIIAYLQFLLRDAVFFRSISFFDYENWMLFGFLMGFGALTGDLIKSFFKRRLGIAPGAMFVPFDQTDFVIGAFVFVMPVFSLTLKIAAVSLALSFVLHIIVNHIAFCMRIRKEKW